MGRLVSVSCMLFGFRSGVRRAETTRTDRTARASSGSWPWKIKYFLIVFFYDKEIFNLSWLFIQERWIQKTSVINFDIGNSMFTLNKRSYVVKQSLYFNPEDRAMWTCVNVHHSLKIGRETFQSPSFTQLTVCSDEIWSNVNKYKI